MVRQGMAHRIASEAVLDSVAGLLAKRECASEARGGCDTVCQDVASLRLAVLRGYR